MTTSFVTEPKEGYAIIRMFASSLDSQTTAELRSELVLLSGNSVSNMIIDLSLCKACDTNGLSAIMIAHRLCKSGHLILAGVSSDVWSILSIQRFDPELDIVQDVEEAEARMAAFLAQEG